MKLNLRSALPLLMGVAVFYSACKKTDNAPAAGPSNSEVSAAIAKNLVQSLAGAYGGASIKDGVNASSTIMSSSSKLKTQSNVQCGFFSDNSLDLNYNQGDSVKTHTTGSVNYFFICNNNQSVGYDLIDSLASSGNGPGYNFNFLVVQNYNVRGLNLNNSNFTLNGTLKSWVDFDYTQTKTSTSVHNIFHFTDLYVHADDNFDITGGDATVESQGKTSTGAWDYTATIHFLGNHKAKLTFLSKTYLIDLTTGTVTPV
ncbi:MAG TPA: hypothetical protein VIM55_13270 [Mucilaginibacter sp.]